MTPLVMHDADRKACIAAFEAIVSDDFEMSSELTCQS